MMKTRYKQFFACVSALLLAISVPAQDLPVLPSDPAVKQGVLPNGMSYYISQNTASKGMADFALVQKTGLYTSSDSAASEAVGLARRALEYVPRLRTRSPQAFMTAHGAAAGRNGFVEVKDDATIFRFPGIRLTDSRDMIDSTLLVIMDMTERVTWTDDDFHKKWYAPADQAIIVCGIIEVLNAPFEKWERPLELQAAAKRPVDKETLEKEFSAADSDEFMLGNFTAEIDGEYFFPASELKALRRSFWEEFKTVVAPESIFLIII